MRLYLYFILIVGWAVSGLFSSHGNLESTYIMIKPEGVRRHLVGNIISRFESKGLVLTSIKLLTPTEELLSNHYSEHRQKPFFTGLVKSLSSGPVVAMVWRGPNAVRLGRNLIGSTNPSEAVPGTIRGDLAVSLDENVCHGSDSVASAEREISIWFPENGDFCG